VAKRESSKRKPILIPRRGAEDAVFARAEKRDAVQVIFVFDKSIANARATAGVKADVHAWIDSVDWKACGGRPTFAPIEIRGDSATITFLGVTRPRPAISALLDALSKRTPREVVLMRRPLRRGKLEAPLAGERPREKDYKSPAAWWKASFDRKGVRPMGEDPAGRVSCIRLEDGTLLFEVRPAVLGGEGLRVIYGLADGVTYPPPNARAAKVTKVVTSAIKKAFGGRPPLLYDAEAETNRVFERIAKDGRFGYVFALPREEQMIAVYGSSYRHRESELFDGIGEAVEELGLEPVVHWIRDHVFLVNLWERKPRGRK